MGSAYVPRYTGPMVDYKCVSIYLGKSPAAPYALPANALVSPEGKPEFLCQQLKRSLLEGKGEPAPFRAKIQIPELPPVDVKWRPVGQTAGIGYWERPPRVGAASLLLNCTEFDNERTKLRTELRVQALAVPPRVWEVVDKEVKPLCVNLFFDLYSFTDPVIATGAWALAKTFFSMFATAE